MGRRVTMETSLLMTSRFLTKPVCLKTLGTVHLIQETFVDIRILMMMTLTGLCTAVEPCSTIQPVPNTTTLQEKVFRYCLRDTM
jgi:hypothetical protein